MDTGCLIGFLVFLLLFFVGVKLLDRWSERGFQAQFRRECINVKQEMDAAKKRSLRVYERSFDNES